MLTKIVNGVTVVMDAAEEAATLAEWAANPPVAPDIVTPEIEIRYSKWNQVMVYMTNELSDPDFQNFVQAVRNQSIDYQNLIDSPIFTWINTTFPTKSYFSTIRQTQLINNLTI